MHTYHALAGMMRPAGPGPGSNILLHGPNCPVFGLQKYHNHIDYVLQKKRGLKGKLTLVRANLFSCVDYFQVSKEPSPQISDQASGLRGHFEFSDSILSRLPAAQAVAEGFLCILLRKSVHLESGFIYFFVSLTFQLIHFLIDKTDHNVTFQMSASLQTET